MTLIEIIYLTGSAVSIGGMAPQIKQLIQTKKSDELSNATWVTWTVTQAIAMVYAVSIHAPLLIITNSVWVGFYVLMTGLIFHYRTRKPKSYTYENVDAQVLDEKLSVVTVPVN